MDGAPTEDGNAALPHKLPRCNALSNLAVESISQANPLFDFKALLEATLAREARADLDPLFSLSPLSSPCPSPQSLPADLEDAFGVSPLSSPGTSLPPSPTLTAMDLPSIDDIPSLVAAYDSDSSAEDASASSQPSRTKARLKARLRARTHRRRGEQRRQERETDFSHFEVRPNVQNKHIDRAESVQTGMKTANASAASAAFVGCNDRTGSKETFTLDRLVGKDSEFNFTYIAWDGRSVKRILDKENRVIAILAGHPEDASWDMLAQEAADALESASSDISLSPNEEDHRRGAFPALRCGVSHGGGSREPSNLFNPRHNAEVLHSLSQRKPFKRLAGFATSVMATHAPRLYAYYVDRLGKLHAHHPNLHRLFPSSVFAAASYNFGPQTVCYKHKDFANLPFGLCAVTALGSFDHRKGGHLVLWDCHLVVEFPAGSTILLPSAIVAHSNTPISPGEKRFSFAQYTAGGLFRWVEHGYRLSSKFYASLSQKQLEEERRKDKRRWKFGLSLFEKVKNTK